MTESSSSSTTSSPAPKTTTSSKTPPEPTPPEGSAEDSGHVASAGTETDLRSLAGMAKIDEKLFDQTAPGATTEIVEHDGQTAAKTEGGDAGPFGLQLSSGEIAGGNIAKVLDPPPDLSKANVPLVKERAAMLSPIGQKVAAYIHRPTSEWGLLGPGDVVKGHMLLLDLNTGEKVRAMDGHKIGEGQLFANLRIFPEALSTGDTIEQILG